MATLSGERRDRHIFSKSLTGATGDNEVPTEEAYLEAGSRLPCRFWQIQLAVSGGPTSGTLKVMGKSPGADEFVDLGGNMDMTGASLVYFQGIFDGIKVVPDGFDGDSYSVYLTASVY